MFPSPIQKLIDQFSRFPTVGPRTASRFVFYLLKFSQQELDNFVAVVTNLKRATKLCSFCFNPFDISQQKEGELCSICSSTSRDTTMLCIVEKETDLVSIEKTKKYKGLYFILGGAVSSLKKEDIQQLRIQELQERIKNPKQNGLLKANFQEIIIATNPTVEGETIALYIERALRQLSSSPVSITRLGRGLPVGGELEYADQETLGSALEQRR